MLCLLTPAKHKLSYSLHLLFHGVGHSAPYKPLCHTFHQAIAESMTNVTMTILHLHLQYSQLHRCSRYLHTAGIIKQWCYAIVLVLLPLPLYTSTIFNIIVLCCALIALVLYSYTVQHKADALLLRSS